MLVLHVAFRYNINVTSCLVNRGLLAYRVGHTPTARDRQGVCDRAPFEAHSDVISRPKELA